MTMIQIPNANNAEYYILKNHRFDRDGSPCSISAGNIKQKQKKHRKRKKDI